VRRLRRHAAVMAVVPLGAIDNFKDRDHERWMNLEVTKVLLRKVGDFLKGFRALPMGGLKVKNLVPPPRKDGSRPERG